MNIIKINSMNPDAHDNNKENLAKKNAKNKADDVDKTPFSDIYDIKRRSFDNNRQATQWQFKDMLEVNKKLNNIVCDVKNSNANEILKPIATEDLLKLTALLRLDN